MASNLGNPWHAVLSPLCRGSPAGVGLAGCGPRAAGGAAAHLDLLDGVHDEGVLKVLHGPLHPVVEGCSPLGVLQVQLVNRFQQFFCPLGMPNGVGKGRC